MAMTRCDPSRLSRPFWAQFLLALGGAVAEDLPELTQAKHFSAETTDQGEAFYGRGKAHQIPLTSPPSIRTEAPVIHLAAGDTM
jgi:hypothetical protein